MIRPILDFFSDPLRLTMLIAGIFVIVLIYFFSRRPKLSKTATAPENVATHPSDYQDLPEERGGVGKVVVKSATETVKEKQDKPAEAPAPQFKETRAPIETMPREEQPASAEDKGEEPNAETTQGTPEHKPTRAVKLQRQAEKIIIVHLKAEEDRPYRGRLFMSAMSDAGLVLGERKIFHHMADEHSNPYINFSVANMHEPGVFELSDIDNFETRGLSFFMQVPMETGNASLAFTQMMSTAQRLARRMGGELFTEDHKPLSVTEINALRVEVEKYV